jgi:acetyl-CoA hydrolase
MAKMSAGSSYPILSAEEAASYIKNGDTVSFSSFTPAGAAKVVPVALAVHARSEHTQERPFKVRVLTGASSGLSIDDELARAEAISWRAPYQSGKTVRNQINRQEVEYIERLYF